MVLNKLGYVTFVNMAQRDELIGELYRADFQTFELDGSKIFDKASLFSNANVYLPHEPGMATHRSWDAFTDVIWGGIFNLTAVNIAFVWTYVENMLVVGLPDLVTAIECFNSIASQLELSHGDPKELRHLRVFLLGTGNNFPPLY